MLITVNKDQYRYEIHSLVKAFYPQEDVKVIVEGDPHGAKALAQEPVPFFRVTFSPEGIRFAADASILQDGPCPADAGTGSAYEEDNAGSQGAEDTADRTLGKREHRVQAPEGEDFSVKGRACKDALKTGLYDLLKELTGRSLPWGDLIGIRPTKLAMTKLLEGKSAEEARGFLVTEHQVSVEKASLAVEIAGRERDILKDIHYENGFSLYVGIPFCPTTCLYCSFPSYNAGLWKDRMDDYLDALEKEMAATACLMEGHPLDTVYIGGGTPTTLSAARLDRLIGSIEHCFPCGNLQEFTVEAGRADSITREKLKALAGHRVTRISVNPQTMKDETLRIIGRHHTVQQVSDAFHMARECGFGNINMDIILGLPGENEEDVQHTVDEIAKLSPDSLTVHSLAVKRASRLRRVIDEKGYPVLLNTDRTMRIAASAAESMGMHPYYLYRQKNMSGNFENTGYARDGKYGIYNILIMEEKQSILALGAGSISKVVLPCKDGSGTRIERCDNPKDVETYLKEIDTLIARKEKLYRG